MNALTCKMEGCSKKTLQFSLGLCHKHYQRWRRGQPETNPCKGCGTMIDSRYKWCPKCKYLSFHGRRRKPKEFLSDNGCPIVGRNLDCPKRCKCTKKGCPTPEELEIAKNELFGMNKIKGHCVESSFNYERWERPVSKIYGLNAVGF